MTARKLSFSGDIWPWERIYYGPTGLKIVLGDLRTLLKVTLNVTVTFKVRLFFFLLLKRPQNSQQVQKVLKRPKSLKRSQKFYKVLK